MSSNNNDSLALLKRVIWLAFTASKAVGAGVFHADAAYAQTEESLFQDLIMQSDDPYSDPRDLPISIHTDYVFGRMMKTSFALETDGTVKVSPEIPHGDYQSWGSVYATAEKLINEAKASLE